MICENCGINQEVSLTELGALCTDCYLLLSQEHFNLIDEFNEEYEN